MTAAPVLAERTDLPPEVSRTDDGAIVLRLDNRRAFELAQMLCHYDVLMATPAAELRRIVHEDELQPNAPALVAPFRYTADVWQHVLVDLITERARAHLAPAVIRDAATGAPR